MKADAIVNRILDDARVQAEQIVGGARARVEELRKNNEDLIEQHRAEAMRAARDDCEELRDRMLRMAALERRKEFLAMKREVIDLAFADALRRMRAMPVKQARAFMGGLVAAAAQGGEELVVDEDDVAAFDRDFVDEICRMTGRTLTLAAQPRKLGGGVLLRRAGMEVNLTYPAILAEKRAALEAEAARMLFEAEKE